MNRPSFDQIFLEICDVVAKRSTCDRRYVGAVITIDNRIVATGYNGSIPGEPHCSDPEEFWQCERCGKKTTTPTKPEWISIDKEYVCSNTFCRGRAVPRKGGHIMVDTHCVRTVHSEINALLQCAYMGVQLRGAGAKIYCNTIPCLTCTRAILAAGIYTIIYSGVYRPSPEVERLAKELPHVKLVYMPLEKGDQEAE